MATRRAAADGQGNRKPESQTPDRADANLFHRRFSLGPEVFNFYQ